MYLKRVERRGSVALLPPAEARLNQAPPISRPHCGRKLVEATPFAFSCFLPAATMRSLWAAAGRLHHARILVQFCFSSSVFIPFAEIDHSVNCLSFFFFFFIFCLSFSSLPCEEKNVWCECPSFFEWLFLCACVSMNVTVSKVIYIKNIYIYIYYTYIYTQTLEKKNV